MNNELAAFRKRKKLTRWQMADLMGISLSYYDKVERLERNPSYSFIKRFKSVFPDACVDLIFFKDLLHISCIIISSEGSEINVPKPHESGR